MSYKAKLNNPKGYIMRHRFQGLMQLVPYLNAFHQKCTTRSSGITRFPTSRYSVKDLKNMGDKSCLFIYLYQAGKRLLAIILVNGMGEFFAHLIT